MYSPKITVIMSVLNGVATLPRCLKSVFYQTYAHKELIIMDGGSTDGSVKIFNDNSGRIAYWESKPDKGIYHAWNKALSHATGEWICFLGSDDYFWQDDVLERLVPLLEIAKKKDIRLVYGRIASINKNGTFRNFLGMPWEKTKSLFAYQLPPHPGLLHHANLFKEHGGFDESFKIAADGEFQLRELMTGDAMFVPEIIVAGIQYGGVSCSSRHLLRLITEDISARTKHGLSPMSIQALKYYARLLFSSLKYELTQNK